ncbi:MAG: hypothetical protein H6741_06870 [Alphaproteobacteria bacterium]|nr:hypothetical protein [Alphaproteobacteria bacterium]
MKRSLALLSALLLSTPALAQDTVDLGTLRDEEVLVVQKLLYPKEDRTEVSFLGGAMIDRFMIAPKVQVGYGKHLSENLGWEVQVGAGYGLGNSTYRELDSTYFTTPEVYRYLGSVTGGITWAPIYAKMNWLGKQVIHHDVYIPALGGVAFERMAWGEQYFIVAPMVSVGVGARVFQGNGNVIRIEVRDDILLENRKQTATMYVEQNIGVHLGFSRLSKKD